MDTIQSEHAVNSIFQPSVKLLRRYGRVASADEVGHIEQCFADLNDALQDAYCRGEVTEAWAIRQEFRALCDVVNTIITSKQTEQKRRRELAA